MIAIVISLFNKRVTDGLLEGCLLALKENNYLGLGIELDTNFTFTDDSIKGKFSVLNPNYKNSDKNLDFSLEATSIDRLGTSGYKSNVTGFSIGTSFEYLDDLRFGLSTRNVIEKISVEWISKFIGYHNKKSAGVFVSGGSVANLMNIAIMRKMKGSDSIREEGIYKNKIMRIYVSEESHSSIDKAMDMLGLGINNLIKIKVDKDFKLDTDLLKEKIIEDINNNFLPIGVIGTAGTTNTGSIAVSYTHLTLPTKRIV